VFHVQCELVKSMLRSQLVYNLILPGIAVALASLISIWTGGVLELGKAPQPTIELPQNSYNLLQLFVDLTVFGKSLGTDTAACNWGRARKAHPRGKQIRCIEQIQVPFVRHRWNLAADREHATATDTPKKERPRRAGTYRHIDTDPRKPPADRDSQDRARSR
jgi:hypothetical protein